MPINKLIKGLDKLRTEFDLSYTDIKCKLLQDISNTQFDNISNYANFHDLLLFIKTFPDNIDILKLAEKNIDLLVNYILSKNNDIEFLKTLNNTGIANTNIEANYNFDIIKTLINRYIFFLEFDSFGAEKTEIFSVFNNLISDIEQCAFTDEDFDIDKWIENSLSSNGKNRLSEIIYLIENSQVNDRLKSDIYSKLGVYIKSSLNDKFSRTLLKIPITLNNSHYHKDGLIKKIDFKQIINTKITEPISINKEVAKQLIDIAQVQLFTLLRELDALTYADENSIEVIKLERGYTIVLYYQKIHKRNAIESLIGYVGFKNGIPYSYGAFWILGYSAKIAFNVFEAFRGGESSYWFAQVIRVAKNHFNIQHVYIEPYQFGRNNEEAILTGAFWFYYKLGFRPIDLKISNLAEKEFIKITKSKTYKTPTSILNKFTECQLELQLQEKTYPLINTTDISLSISKLIQTEFKGNRIQFENTVIKEMLIVLDIKILSSITSLTQTESFKKTSLIYYGIINKIKEWETEDKNKLIEIMTMKLSENEKIYITKFQNHKNLIYALFEMTSKFK